MKRTLIGVVAVLLTALVLASCGGPSAPSQQSTTSGLKFRVLVSQDVSALTVAPGLVIVDGTQDALARVPSISAGNSPGIMVVSPDYKLTLSFSPSDNTISVVRNSLEQSAGKIALPDWTESILISPASSTAYAAVRNAAVLGQPAGAVEVLSLTTGATTASVPVPSVHYLAQSPNGNRILAFGDNSDSVTVIYPSLVGTGSGASQTIAGFDRPVGAAFSSDNHTAYVFNCGRECGGVSASVTVLDLTTTPPTPGITLPVEGATTGLLNGSTLYMAGTGIGFACASSTAATTCGRLNVVDTSSMRVTTAGVEITDGYHHRIALGSNGLLFVGARNCTNINQPAPGEVRGCLSLFNTASHNVVIPPATGDATGLQPIPNRTVVYVVQNGELQIYDTNTGKLQSKQVDIVGQAVDVKVIDPAP